MPHKSYNSSSSNNSAAGSNFSSSSGLQGMYALLISIRSIMVPSQSRWRLYITALFKGIFTIYHSLTQVLNPRRTKPKLPKQQEILQTRNTQPWRPNLRREEAFRIRRREMEVNNNTNRQSLFNQWKEVKRVEELFGAAFTIEMPSRARSSL